MRVIGSAPLEGKKERPVYTAAFHTLTIIWRKMMSKERLNQIIREIVDRYANNAAQPNFDSEAFRARIVDDIWGALGDKLKDDTSSRTVDELTQLSQDMGLYE